MLVSFLTGFFIGAALVAFLYLKIFDAAELMLGDAQEACAYATFLLESGKCKDCLDETAVDQERLK